MSLSSIIGRAKNKNAEIQYAFDNLGLKMTNHGTPVSISEREFMFLRDFVIKHNLQRGFELATAFGVSATAIGLGMKATGGKLVTMDAYVEEQFNTSQSYRYLSTFQVSPEQCDGWKSVHFLLEEYGLKDVVTPTVGWSPDDTEKCIKQVFDTSTEKLDFAFIDALHYPEAVMRDIESVLPFLGERFVLFLHDVHCFDDTVTDFLVETFGKSYTTPPECAYAKRYGYNLSYISKLGDES